MSALIEGPCSNEKDKREQGAKVQGPIFVFLKSVLGLPELTQHSIFSVLTHFRALNMTTACSVTRLLALTAGPLP